MHNLIGMLRRIVFIFLVVLTPFWATSQPPSGYYADTENLSGEELMAQLHNIIKDHYEVTYTGLWDAFYYTDRRSDGKVWDMYTTCNFVFFEDQDTGSGGTVECDVYNREHSFPRSWFGGAVAPMNTDLFHLYPTDKKVNAVRDNYPYGKVGTATYTSSNGSKLGSSATPGYSGIVFEPADEYKGDFARSYFYMATRYYNIIDGWNSDMLNGTHFPAFSNWAKQLLLQWHQADPVSQKEIDRNNIIYEDYQGNRNPFIDHPEFALLIWSQSTTPVTFTSTPVLQVNVFETYSYTVKATGNADAYVTLTCTQKPPWMEFQQTASGMALLTGTPLIENIGQHSVSITATDGITTAAQNFTVTVVGNTTPVVFTSSPVTSVTAYDSYMYSVSSAGHSLATITVTCSEKPDWMEFAQTGNGIAQLSGVPGAADVGTHSVALQATDGLSTAHQEFTVTVSEPQVVFLTSPDTYAKVDELYEYQISVEVSEHPSAQVNVVCVEKPQWLSFTSGASNQAYLSGTPGMQDIGYHDVQLKAVYGDFSVQQNFSILVFEHGTILDYIETFENIPDISPAYELRIWSGDNDFQWMATQARTDQSIDGKAICLGDSGEPYVQSQNLTGGCSRVMFTCQQKFEGNGGTISLLINEQQVGEPFSVTTDALVADFDNIAIYGNFVLKLKSNGSVPVAIDNLTWQLNPSDNPPVIIGVSHSPIHPSNGDEVFISAEIESENGIESVFVMSGSSTDELAYSDPMDYSDGYYGASIIVPDEVSRLYYRVIATDRVGLSTFSDIFEIEIFQNQAPEIGRVEYYPLNPDENQSVSVRSMVSDPDLDAFVVFLKWYISGQTTVDSIPMTENFGYYSCTIPGNPAESQVFFQVFAQDENGAIGSSSLYSYSVSGGSSILNNQSIDFMVFPNPTKGKIFIEGRWTKPIKIEIFGIMGNHIYSMEKMGTQGLIEIDLGMLERGIYLVKISEGRMVGYYKVIKE